MTSAITRACRRRKWRALDLNGLIREVLGLYESSRGASKPVLPAKLPPVLGDATQLRQIIHNLLRNAEDALEGHADGVIRDQHRARRRGARGC